jgi:uncharacterized protein YegL
MPYQAEISRVNPTCFLFLVDHSSSMASPIMGVPENPKKSVFVADALNKTIQSLIVSASKDMDVRRYYQVGVIGYGSQVTSALGGALKDQDLVWIDDLYMNPLRIEDRIKKESDGVGGFLEVKMKLPVWVDPVSRGQTPMCQALERSRDILSAWVAQYPDSYPPTVINLTDGESNDGDPRKPAAELTSLATNDGNVVLLTVHSSSREYAQQIFFPDDLARLPDHFSKTMFQLSSVLPPAMLRTAAELLNSPLNENAHGFVYNADIAGIVQALEIGTRPSIPL